MYVQTRREMDLSEGCEEERLGGIRNLFRVEEEILSRMYTCRVPFWEDFFNDQ